MLKTYYESSYNWEYQRKQWWKYNKKLEDNPHKNVKTIEASMRTVIKFQLYYMIDSVNKLYYIGQTEREKLEVRRDEHINNEKEGWSNEAEIFFLANYWGLNRNDVERVEKQVIEEMSVKDIFKGYKWNNQIYHKKMKREKQEKLYEAPKELLQITLDDYLKRFLPHTNSGGYLKCSIKSNIWGEDSKTNPIKVKIGRNMKRAEKEMFNKKVKLFKRHFPLLYETLKYTK